MNSKPMLFECLVCKETYLADNLCDGYRCPKCDGHIAERGFIKELEESARDMQDKINRAKENGSIRKYKKTSNQNTSEMKQTNKLYVEGEVISEEYIYGIDLSSKKDLTITVSFNSERFNKDLIKRLTKELEERKRNIGDYIQCSYE